MGLYFNHLGKNLVSFVPINQANLNRKIYRGFFSKNLQPHSFQELLVHYLLNCHCSDHFNSVTFASFAKLYVRYRKIAFDTFPTFSVFLIIFTVSEDDSSLFQRKVPLLTWCPNSFVNMMPCEIFSELLKSGPLCDNIRISKH